MRYGVAIDRFPFPQNADTGESDRRNRETARDRHRDSDGHQAGLTDVSQTLRGKSGKD